MKISIIKLTNKDVLYSTEEHNIIVCNVAKELSLNYHILAELNQLNTIDVVNDLIEILQKLAAINLCKILNYLCCILIACDYPKSVNLKELYDFVGVF